MVRTKGIYETLNSYFLSFQSRKRLETVGRIVDISVIRRQEERRSHGVDALSPYAEMSTFRPRPHLHHTEPSACVTAAAPMN